MADGEAGRGLGRESKIEPDSRPKASQLLFQLRSMAARVQPSSSASVQGSVLLLHYRTL